jgi:hypothetical protein
MTLRRYRCINACINRRTNRRIIRCVHPLRTAVIALCLTAAYSTVAQSQELAQETTQETKRKADLACTSSDAATLCPSAETGKESSEGQVPRPATLPGSPQPQTQSNPAGSSFVPGQDKNSAVLFLPVKSARRLDFNDKLTIYVHQQFGPPAVIIPVFGAGMALANPKSHYPREWKDGAGAFGRNYGDALALVGSQRTARFLTGVALHEDPRYARSSSKNPLMRTAHAILFTFIDKTDSGRNTIAFSNFAGAAAGGFVGSAYLPHGYNDLTHAEQRMAAQFASIAIQNIAAEFQPQWAPLVRKLRINKILPEWWVPQHER